MSILTPTLGVNFAAEGSASGVVDQLTRFDHKLGNVVNGEKGQKWMAVQMTSAISQYAAVGVSENWLAQPLTIAMLNDGWFVGFAQIALTKGKRGWIAVSGSDIKCLALKACAAEVRLYATATAGVIDDAGTADDLIWGINAVTAASASAPATGQAIEIIATFPSRNYVDPVPQG
jgi:hypothetical protein|tara:strand:- start:142 stop:666 length:525 start_codon:yes stop_codon:yes gene_type:complete